MTTKLSRTLLQRFRSLPDLAWSGILIKLFLAQWKMGNGFVWVCMGLEALRLERMILCKYGVSATNQTVLNVNVEVAGPPWPLLHLSFRPLLKNVTSSEAFPDYPVERILFIFLLYLSKTVTWSWGRSLLIPVPFPRRSLITNFKSGPLAVCLPSSAKPVFEQLGSGAKGPFHIYPSDI